MIPLGLVLGVYMLKVKFVELYKKNEFILCLFCDRAATEKHILYLSLFLGQSCMYENSRGSAATKCLNKDTLVQL